MIDLHAAHFWDITSISALDRVILKLRHQDIPVEVVGMNQATASMVDRVGVYDKAEASLSMSPH